jgi:hypothetical protein
VSGIEYLLEGLGLVPLSGFAEYRILSGIILLV